MVLKTCQELMQAGFIAGRPRGRGYRLARSPDKVTVTEIVDLFEPEETLFHVGYTFPRPMTGS